MRGGKIMNKLKSPLIAISFVIWGTNVFAQKNPGDFIPTVFWGNNADKGIVLATPSKMGIIDSKGIKYGEILTSEPVLSAYMAPDGKKLVYTTSSGLWLAKLETQETFLIASGACDYLRWDSNSLSFIFATFAKNEGAGSNAYNIKLFWADGDGKNLKQVYP